MRNPRLTTTAILLTALIGCGGEEPDLAESNSEATAETSRTTTTEDGTTDPCTVLDETLIRASFAVPEQAEIELRSYGSSSFPLCSADWEAADAEARKARAGEAFKEYMEKLSRREKASIPKTAKLTDGASLTLLKPFEDSDTAMRSFDTAMKRLSDGITTKVEDREITFQRDVFPVEGVGDKAMWQPQSNQLSVVDGNRMFHVAANTGGGEEENRTIAIKLANAIIERL